MKNNFTLLRAKRGLLSWLFSLLCVTSVLGQTCPGIYFQGTNNVLSTSAEFGWDCAQQYATFALEYKPVTATTWSSLTGIQSDNDGYGRSNPRILLTDLSPNTTYQWRVKTVCASGNPSDYVAGTNFTTTCPGIYFQGTANVLSTSAEFGWDCAQQYATFALEYKPVTATTWSSLTGIQSDNDGYGRSNPRILLTDLSPNTTYQWRVKTVCASGNPSDYVAGTNFTTTCPGIYFQGTANVLSTSAEFGWDCAQQYATFALEYKPVTATTWSSLTGIQSDNDGYGRSNPRILLTDLSPNTTYQWRVKTVCASGNPSDYVAGTNFTTTCPGIYFQGTANVLSTSAEFGWDCAQQYATFALEYKPVTATTWSSLTGIQSDNDGYGRSNPRILLTGLNPNTTYQWRVRTVCASGNPSDYVAGTNFTTLCAAPSSLNSNNVTHTSAQLTWLTVNAGVSYEIRYRPQGITTWTSQTVTSPTTAPDVTTNLFLTGLTSQTTYEWQARTICTGLAPIYSASAFFTTNCPLPTGLVSSSVLANSAQLSWTPGTTGISTDLQYQLQGSTTWTTVPGITANTYSLTGLNVGAAYRWQVRGACTATVSSSYVGPVSFTTTCLQPSSLVSTSIATNAAQLNWSNVNTGATFTLQWRPQSVITWTTVSGLLATTYSLTGLSAGTSYLWQVSAVCTPTISSSYAGPVSFNTATTCTTMYSLKNGSWNDPSVWSCGRVPNSTDVVRVRHLITVPDNYTATALQVFFDMVPKVALGQNAQLNLGQ